MDQLTNTLQNLSIKKLLRVKYLSNNLVNKQKCFVSRYNFHELLLKPGSVVLIRSSSKYYYCQIYPKSLLCEDVIEIDTSVQCFNFNNIHPDLKEIINISDITELKEVVIFKEIHIKIIFESIKFIKMWQKQSDEFLYILKNYILKLFFYTNNCYIDLNDLPSRQKMGISKLNIISTSVALPNTAIGKIGPKTKIVIGERISLFQYEQTVTKIPQLFSVDRPLKRLIEVVKINEVYQKMDLNKNFAPTKQILLVGPSGCGKSSLVRLVAQLTNCTMVTIMGHEVNKSEPGETESTLRDYFEEAFQYAELSGKCIINLEEVDNLCPQRLGAASHVQRAVSQLLLLLDKAQTIPGIIVIATTSKPNSLESSVRRHGRLETEMYIGPPTENERENLIQQLLIDLQLPLEMDDQINLSRSIANMTPGYVGADLKLLCHTMAWKIHDKHVNNVKCDNSLEFWQNEFKIVILNITPASLKGTLGVVTTQNASLNELGGLKDIKKALEMTIIWPIQHADAFYRLGIPRPRGVLLYGPPGCAKTSLVRALASLGTFALLSISAAELYSPYVGDAERLISQLFQRARENTPCIIFIDEIDALAGSRGEKNQVNSEVQDRIIASLLTQMDGVGHRMLSADKNRDFEIEYENDDDGVIVIGATNRPDMVDAALMRPGRFDKHILVPPPDTDARLDILKTYTSKMPLAENVDLFYIASQTECYSGADLKNICSEAALIAMTEDGMDVSTITCDHFSKALTATRPSLSEHQIKQYFNFNLNKVFS